MMLKKYINASNCITFVRIIGSVVLIFLTSFSPEFYIIYSVCGLSDAVDGYIARRNNTTSEFGARLDSVADIFFYAVMIIKIFPKLIKILPSYVWYVLGAAIFTRLISYIVAALKYKTFASQHTYLNKLTGLCVFIAPYIVVFSFGKYVCIGITVIGLIASIEELLIHLTQKEYFPDQKSILKLNK